MDPRLVGEHWIFVEDSPFLPAHGGGEREHLGMLQAAAARGLLDLAVVPTVGRFEPAPYRAALSDAPIIATGRRTSPFLLLHPWEPFVTASRPARGDLVERVRNLAPAATGILISSYKSWRIGAALAEGLQLPAVLRMHNREGAYHHSLAAGTRGPRGWALRLEARRIDRDERRLCKASWLAGTADISLDDARWRRSAGGHGVIHVPPFAVDPTCDPPPRKPAKPPRVLFLGALDVATNVVAVRWLLERVWPAILQARPGALLEIVGRAPAPPIVELAAATPGVQLFMDVPSVEPFLSRASVAVNPAISGSGVNIKLIEYLNARIPLVSTSLATRGLPLRPGNDLLVEDQPEGFARAVTSLLADPVAAERMAATGRSHLVELIDAERNLASIADMMHGVH